jgi:hypothetical protein
VGVDEIQIDIRPHIPVLKRDLVTSAQAGADAYSDVDAVAVPA